MRIKVERLCTACFNTVFKETTPEPLDTLPDIVISLDLEDIVMEQLCTECQAKQYEITSYVDVLDNITDIKNKINILGEAITYLDSNNSKKYKKAIILLETELELNKVQLTNLLNKKI